MYKTHEQLTTDNAEKSVITDTCYSVSIRIYSKLDIVNLLKF